MITDSKRYMEMQEEASKAREDYKNKFKGVNVLYPPTSLTDKNGNKIPPMNVVLIRDPINIDDNHHTEEASDLGFSNYLIYQMWGAFLPQNIAKMHTVINTEGKSRIVYGAPELYFTPAKDENGNYIEDKGRLVSYPWSDAGTFLQYHPDFWPAPWRNKMISTDGNSKKTNWSKKDVWAIRVYLYGEDDELVKNEDGTLKEFIMPLKAGYLTAFITVCQSAKTNRIKNYNGYTFAFSRVKGKTDKTEANVLATFNKPIDVSDFTPSIRFFPVESMADDESTFIINDTYQKQRQFLINVFGIELPDIKNQEDYTNWHNEYTNDDPARKEINEQTVDMSDGV